jgi:predicted ATPase
VFDLFRRIEGESAASIRIETRGDTSPLEIGRGLYRVAVNEEGLSRLVLAATEEAVNDPTETAIIVFRGGKQVALLSRSLWGIRNRARDGERLFLKSTSGVAYVPARGFSDEQAAAVWDALVQGPRQNLVLQWLRLVDSRIEDVVYIEGRRGTRLALLKVQGQGRIPLRSMGDGLTRLFHIALAAASSSQGVLLIDEFENGLHWEVQRNLWTAIAEAAQAFDLQVFATTHSRDCIEGFNAASDDATIYRLERRDDDIFATHLPSLNVGAAIRQHVEVR